MAKYDVEYRCGHSATVQLVGKHTERERKLEWMSGNLCPACYGKEQREIEATLPITATITTTGLDVTADGLLCEITLTGGTINRKDDIKALGYSWSEPTGGLMSMLAAKAPRKTWCKSFRLDIADPSSSIQPAIEELKGLADKMVNGLGVLDVEMAKKRMAEFAAKKDAEEQAEAAVASLAKPEKPACHPTRTPGYVSRSWNGKYYGRKGSYNYYAAGKNYKLTDAEYAELAAYTQALEEYASQVQAIKKGVVA